MSGIKKIFLTILLIFFSGISFCFLSSYVDEKVYAESSCPSSMDPDSRECFDYLQEQLKRLKKEESNMQSKIADVEYQKMSLSEKISYIAGQISQTEQRIKEIQLQVAASNVQIKLYEKSIKEKEDDISLLKQEVDVLEESTTKRITEVYKSSYIGMLELIFDSKNFSSILRKTKYLAVTRSQDRESIEEYSAKVNDLEDEEILLAETKIELEKTRNEIEKEKEELADSMSDLDRQKSEREELLQEAYAAEKTLLQALRNNKDQQAALDAQVMAYINSHMDEMVEGGAVAAGSLIGYVYNGTSACSTGAHLHFGVNSSSSGNFYANVDIFANGLLRTDGPSGIVGWDGWEWPNVVSGAYVVPIGSNAIMSQDNHDGAAIDLIKQTNTGGSPVYAAAAGTLWRGLDQCNQNYIIITHPNGYRTIYVHLAYSN